MRKIKTIETVRQFANAVTQTRMAIVFYHADWDEFWVRFYIDGVHQRKADYPADSKEDALATADYFVNRQVV